MLNYLISFSSTENFVRALCTRVFRAVNRSVIKPGLSAYIPLTLFILRQEPFFLAGMKNKD
jgi:hypothetical protein